MIVSDYITPLRERLFDPSPGVGYANDELIGYLNEATRALCAVKPDAYLLQADIPLVAGVAQALPAAGLQVFDITQNAVSGRVVIQTTRTLLDAENRFWPAATQETDVQNFTVDPRAPRIFYVTPPNDGTGSVKCLYGALPPALATLADTVLTQDVYQPALIAFAASRAWLKPSKRRDPAASAAAANEWAMLVGAKTKAQIELSPRVGAARGPN